MTTSHLFEKSYEKESILGEYSQHFQGDSDDANHHQHQTANPSSSKNLLDEWTLKQQKVNGVEDSWASTPTTWPPSSAALPFQQQQQYQNDRRTPQMVTAAPITGWPYSNSSASGSLMSVQQQQQQDTSLTYQPARPTSFNGAETLTGLYQKKPDLDSVVALARKLNQKGVLRDDFERATPREAPQTVSNKQLISSTSRPNLINPTLLAVRDTDNGPFGRPRNHSLPDAANALNVGHSRSNEEWPPNSNTSIRRMEPQRKRNPYGPAAILGEYNKNYGGGGAVNPYAPTPSYPSSKVKGNGRAGLLQQQESAFNANGSYQQNEMHRMSNGRSSAPRGVGGANWMTRACDVRRQANNPLNHPPPTNDFFASPRNQFLTGDTQLQLQIVRSFGEYGPSTGQFNMPQGLCLGKDDEIIIADTLSHRIQFFDKSGSFMFLWGCPGVSNGHLWHPRKVAYIPETQHLVVSDRVNGCSRIQIFERAGKYLRTLGNLHGLRMALNTTTAGLTVYNQQIIVVEVQPSACVMLNEDGSVVHWFSLDNIMVEPSDIVVINQRHYISDFRDHCVCVFNNWGHLIQRLGATSDGLIRYPRGLGISASGNLLVADTDQNRFHISMWSSETGELLSYHALNDVKFSHSCGVVMNSTGQIITAVKKDHMVVIMKLIDSIVSSGMPGRDNRQLGWNVNAPSFHSRRVEELQ